jgi:hypothetical protein
MRITGGVWLRVPRLKLTEKCASLMLDTVVINLCKRSFGTGEGERKFDMAHTLHDY